MWLHIFLFLLNKLLNFKIIIDEHSVVKIIQRSCVTVFAYGISSKTVVSITNRISTLIQAGCRPLALAQRFPQVAVLYPNPTLPVFLLLICNIHETVVHFYHYFTSRMLLFICRVVVRLQIPRLGWASSGLSLSPEFAQTHVH